jgi:hypothetical protein
MTGAYEFVFTQLDKVVPKQISFQHKDHPRVLLRVVQEMMARHPVVPREEASKIKTQLRKEAEQYRTDHSRYVTFEDYVEVWPDIDAMLDRVSKPVPKGE